MIHYAVVIFLSAFLIFQIQPMISKYILPWFGGTPAVWSTSMLFFQVLLLGGYSYAHLLAKRWQPRKQGGVHIILLVSAGLMILLLAVLWKAPLLPNATWKPTGSDYPIWRILSILLVSVGLPYFVLSTTGPLLQSWFRISYPDRSPYRLYALSNLGSLLGLITYPILVEPLLALRHQTTLWSAGFLAFAVLCAIGAWRLRNTANKRDEYHPAQNDMGSKKITLKQYLLWIALAGCASLMLLATTNQMSQEISVIPFLWILPLVIYLLSFILTFESERWYLQFNYLVGLMLATLMMFAILLLGQSVHILLQIGAYSVLLFFICMVCHGELYRSRPDPRHLTAFYLSVSIGGALGGVFVNFAAPLLFSGYWEFLSGIVVTWVMFFAVLLIKRSSILEGKLFWFRAPLLAGMIIISGIFLSFYVGSYKASALYSARNFYGVVQVKETTDEKTGESKLLLLHGITVHGAQYRSEGLRREPTAYYHQNSGSGLANYVYRDLMDNPLEKTELRIGVVGMGIATLAAYGEPDDYMRFYEINPAVIQLAEGEKGFFSYLSQYAGSYDIVDGDARIALEAELLRGQQGNFDILFIDAFNSGSPPAHLLTKEAFAVYLQHLKPGGILVVNVTNKYLDINSIVQQQAIFYELDNALIITGTDLADTSSQWVLLSDTPDFFSNPIIASRLGLNGIPVKFVTHWTDDYSNLFQIIK